MPRANLHEVTSTSTAAQLARDKPGAAAIASRQAAVQYDLQIVAERIEDSTMTEDEALAVARRIMHDNAARVYGFPLLG